MKRDEILSMLADILSRIIHDYNNVIGAVEGYATLLSAEVKDSGAIEDLNEILNVVSKASKIRNKLALFYRKNVSGKEYMDINDIIVQKSSHYENKSNIKVNLALSKNISSLYAKNDEIDLMITEFFENAIYHSKKENLEISVKTYSIENDLILEFSDNGAGIKEENLDKVFFPFYTTVENNMKDGLGLSWIWGVSRRHNAKVEVESREGEYLKFTVKFKLK